VSAFDFGRPVLDVRPNEKPAGVLPAGHRSAKKSRSVARRCRAAPVLVTVVLVDPVWAGVGVRIVRRTGAASGEVRIVATWIDVVQPRRAGPRGRIRSHRCAHACPNRRCRPSAVRRVALAALRRGMMHRHSDQPYQRNRTGGGQQRATEELRSIVTNP
jgi:hypothetical protein